MRAKLRISKLDAARRQLETAIRLYFCEADPVSIHALAAAAHKIIQDLNRKRSGTAMLVNDLMLRFVKPGCEKAVLRKVNAPTNFFKHADRDPDDTVQFDPSVTEFFLFDSVAKYQELAKERVPLLLVFQVWFMTRNSDMFDLPAPFAEVAANVNKDPHAQTRDAFFAAMLPLATRLNCRTP